MISPLSLLAMLLGALVGSFLNVVILRLPDENASIVLPPSHCPHCQTPLHWYENIPVLSFLFLRGRCRSCRAAISWQYPLVEAVMAALSFCLFQRFGLSVAFGIYFLFVAALLVVIFVDFKHQLIPDLISLPGIVIGFAVSFVNPFVSWQDAAVGFLVGGALLYGIALGYYLLTKRVGMGGGDIKLLAMIGVFLGWQSLPFVVFSSSILGSLVGVGAMIKQGKGGKTMIPYGPFLSVGALLYLFFRERILEMIVLWLRVA
ncbi:MAG: prepilin peptidase [Desulfobulbaceae bacterium]|nr:prepilin peptidase [Desulfobulbaceae bacterium]